MTESAGASPPKDQDIFGNELRLTGGERHLLSQAGRIFLKKILQVDTHSKKGDPTEPKTLVISSSRCYVLSQGASPKVEISFNFLRIHHLECTEKKLTFHLANDPRPRVFHSARADSIQIIGLITAQLKNVFPITQLDLIIKTSFDSDPLRTSVSSLRDSLLGAMDRVDATTISGFLTSYGFLCDFFSVPFNSEIAWYMNNVYLAHGFRDLNLTDLDHLPQKDILPVMSTLRHNEFFEGFVAHSGKMAPEFIEELSFVLNTSQSLKKLVLTDCTLRPENLSRLSNALKHNTRSVLTYLDLSDNVIDDKSMEAFGGALESLPHGLQHLRLANCKITARGGSLLANSMKQNKNMQFTLVHFDLSGNPLGPDPQGALAFIQEPQTIATLNLSQCNLNFEFVVPVLNRGCQQHLSDLNLSGNAGKGKKGIHGASVGAGLQQFLSSAIAIRSLNLSNCKLAGEVVSSLLEGLSVNPNVTGLNLDVSSNELGVTRDPYHLSEVLARTNCLHEINISCSGLDNVMPELVEAIATNTTLKHVFIGRNFNNNKVRAAALKGLASLLQRDDCHLQSLCVDDSKLKELTSVILNALDDNTSLRKLNISGNGMGNHGARSLAKTLLTNTCLSEVEWDRNEVGAQGFSDVASALEHNYTLQAMPLPLHDISKAGRVEESVQSIQRFLCRNHSDERLKVELAARHRHRLLTATQQSSVVSRELAQLEDLLQWAISVHGNEHEDVVSGQRMKEQAYTVQKVTDGLYSPQVESEQFESITKQVKELVQGFMDRMFIEQVEETAETMVTRSMKECPGLLNQQSQERLRALVMHKQDGDYQHVKRAVARKTAPEIINHISAINLDTAANISELLVEQILVMLDQANQKLLKLKKAARSNNQTPDTKVSRNFTFRVQEDQSPTKKKKRVRKADPDDEEEVDLPSTPLVTEGPVLQHLGKTRPKPARLQQSSRRRPQRPSMKPSAAIAIEEESSSSSTPAPTEKPPETQPKPAKAKPLLPKPKAEEEPVSPVKPLLPKLKTEEEPVSPVKPLLPKLKTEEEPVKLVKYEAKPDDSFIEVKSAEEVKAEQQKPVEQEQEEAELKSAELQLEQLKLEMLKMELEMGAKETKLADPEPEVTTQPKADVEKDKQESKIDDSKEDSDKEGGGGGGGEGVSSEEPSPSPVVDGDFSGDGEKQNIEATSDLGESAAGGGEGRLSLSSPEIEQIVAETHTSSKPTTTGAAAPEEIKANEKVAAPPAAAASSSDESSDEEEQEKKKKEPEEPSKPTKVVRLVEPVKVVEPAAIKEVDRKWLDEMKVVSDVPSSSEVKSEPEKPKEEIKIPKVSPKPKLRSADSAESPELPSGTDERRGTSSKETPPVRPKKPKPKTPPISPRHSSIAAKEFEARKSGLIKQLGRSKEGDGEERISRISDRGLSGEWEIVDHPDASKSSPDVAKKPPPPVASKPKPSAPEPGSGGGIGEEQNTGSANSSPKKMPGMVAMAPMNELANVLKGVALKPKDQVGGTSSEETAPPQVKKSIPAPAPKPRPKPRPTKRIASAGDAIEGSPSVDDTETNGTLC